MKLVIPYVAGGLAPQVSALGIRCGAEFVNVGASDTAYYELLNRLWTAGGSFVLLEQDVLPEPELLTEVWGCPEPWCAFVYPYLFPDKQDPRRQLIGLTWGVPGKYTGDLLRRYPDTLAQLASPDKKPWYRGLGATHWKTVGAAFQDQVLVAAGQQPHIHLRPARHLRVEGITTKGNTKVEARDPLQPPKPGELRGGILLTKLRLLNERMVSQPSAEPPLDAEASAPRPRGLYDTGDLR
ncbi:MAG: hypothetical protein ACYDB4_17815 [Candidatus Dormibacteraceae bacterium]